MSALSDMSKLVKSVQDIYARREDFSCFNCKQVYKRKWCSADDKPCYFCKNFLPMRDTYLSILRDHDWHFLKSGESDRELFYPDFLDNLKKWADRFHVFPTKEDLKTEAELREIKNWTRDEPECDY